MWWVIWVVLLVVSGIYLGMRAWGLWDTTKELGAELAIAERRLDDVQSQLALLEERTGPSEQLAVFADSANARKERERAKAASRRARHGRRAVTRPAWAKHVD